MFKTLTWENPPVRLALWGVLIGAVGLFLLYGLPGQGFWEAPPVDRNASVQPQVPRTTSGSEPTEFSRFLALEKPESTSWPILVQWFFRGSARLPGPVEFTSRIPALLAMLFLWSIGVWGVWMLLRGRNTEGSAEAGKTAWWTGLAILSMPAFLLSGRILHPDALVVFFASCAVLTAQVGVSAWLPAKGSSVKKGSRLLRLGLPVMSALFLVAATLSSNWFQGLAFPVLAMGVGVWFAGRGANLPRFVYLAAGILCALVAGMLLFSLSTGRLLPDANPALAVPSGSRPHAVFTFALVRTIFGSFPWSIPALIGLFPVSGEKNPKIRFFRMFCAGWLLVALLSGAYHEMRIGPAAMTGLLPMAMLGALAWRNILRLFHAPALALLVGLFSLLLFRDFALYPQLTAELVTTYEIPGVGLRVTGFRWPVLMLVLPLGVLVVLRLATFVPGWVAFWQDLRRQSLLFALGLWPLTWLARFIGWLRGRFFSNWHPVDRLKEKLVRVRVLQEMFVPASSVVFFAFAGWFALFALPTLTREFSTRPVFAAARKVDSSAALAVFEVSPLPAPVYAGRSATVLAGDPDLTRFMKTDESRQVVFPRKWLGRLHHQSRIGSWKYHVLHTDSPTYMLATTRLPAGSRDVNPLLAWVHDESPKMTYSIASELDGRLELVGYDLPRTATRGKQITIRLAFSVRYPLLADNKVFIHLDPPHGTRITADHDPVEGLLPTRYFPPNTFVVDEHTFRIPRVGFPLGRYGVFVGLFAGNNRVKVTDGAHAGQNRIPLGQMEITDPPSVFGCR